MAYVKTGSDLLNETNAVSVNLFEGNHTLKWAIETGAKYFNINALNIIHLGDISLTDCAEIYAMYPDQSIAGDINNDCHVNLDDLALLVNEWTNNYANQ